MSPWPEWVVEVWCDGGSDGHTDYDLVGYRFVPASALNDLDPREGLSRCMLER